jgi:hypothetical protein
MFGRLYGIVSVAVLSASVVCLDPAASQTASADELKVLPLTGGTMSSVDTRSGGLVNFVRGITLKAGPGHRSGPVQLGLWKAQGAGNGYRIELTPHHGIPGNGNVPGMNREDSRCVKDIDNRYRHATSRNAAATAITILNRQNEPAWRKYYRWQVRHHKVSRALRKDVARINDQCKRHSPFHASMRTEAVYLGQVGTGKVDVLAARGLSAPAWLHVRTEAIGSRILHAAHGLNSHGSAGFSYRLTDPADARATSTVTGPDATRADLLVTPDGNTRLLVNSYKSSAQASSKLRQKVLPRPAVKVHCGYDCNGKGSVHVKAKVPAKAGKPVKFTARNGGKNHNWYVRPGHKHGTTFRAADASQVKQSYCYVRRVGGKCVSKVHDYGHTTEVVAPAWPSWTEQSSGNTANGSAITISLFAATSTPRFDRAWIIVNGKTVQSLNLSKSTGMVAKTFHLKKGRIQIKFQAYRNSDFTGALLHEPKVFRDLTLN